MRAQTAVLLVVHENNSIWQANSYGRQTTIDIGQQFVEVASLEEVERIRSDVVQLLDVARQSLE